MGEGGGKRAGRGEGNERDGKGRGGWESNPKPGGFEYHPSTPGGIYKRHHGLKEVLSSVLGKFPPV